MAEVSQRFMFEGRRLIRWSSASSALGFGLCALGLWVAPDRAWLSYLMAYAFAVSIAVGGLVFLMIGYAVNARWVSVVRRLNEITAFSLPALALLFIPILFGLDALYPWKAPPPSTPGHLLHLFEHRSSYLNTSFFTVRAAVYFAIWITAAALLRRWSIRRDRQKEAATSDGEAALRRERVLSSALLPPVGLAITFAAFDWLMTLESTWLSTIFGVYFFAGGFIGALSALILLAHASRVSGALGPEITENHFYALGRLLLAFVIFWAYAAFFQAMLVTIANKPDEVVFYLKRTDGTWKVFVYILALGHFGLPFLALLPRRIKFRPRSMAWIAGWLLLMHLGDVYWLVIPAKGQPGFAPHWLDLAALLAVLGAAVAFAAWRQRGVSLLAAHDPFLVAGLKYRSPL